MKLTLDCDLTAELAHLQRDSALSYLMAKGRLTPVSQALEALFCEQFGLKQSGLKQDDLKQDSDLPLAAISASVDGLDVSDAYWLRADPVHFVMQRDSFSLSEPVPILLKAEHAALMLASLNQHFAQDDLLFCIGKSGAWYMRAMQTQHIKTTLPSIAVEKNVHHFMPAGAHAAKWKAVLNEVQMLLHEHPANIEREAAGLVAVNSVWLSGGGVAPVGRLTAQDVSLVVAQSPLYEGMAKQASIAYQTNTNFADLLSSGASHVRVKLPANGNVEANWFQPTLAAIKANKISQLTLNLGFYEKTLVLEIKPIDLYKFWRKAKPMAHYLT